MPEQVDSSRLFGDLVRSHDYVDPDFLRDLSGRLALGRKPIKDGFGFLDGNSFEAVTTIGWRAGEALMRTKAFQGVVDEADLNYRKLSYAKQIELGQAAMVIADRKVQEVANHLEDVRLDEPELRGALDVALGGNILAVDEWLRGRSENDATRVLRLVAVLWRRYDVQKILDGESGGVSGELNLAMELAKGGHDDANHLLARDLDNQIGVLIARLAAGELLENN